MLTRSPTQNDCLNLIFAKYRYVVCENMTRNGRKLAIYELQILGINTNKSEKPDAMCDFSRGHRDLLDGRLKAYVSQEILNWHSLRHSHSAKF